MNPTDPQNRAAYEATRAAFKNLKTPDKTAFVLEATFDTIGQAVAETGRGLADLFERVGKEDFWKGDPFRSRPADSGAPTDPAAGPRRPSRRPPSEDVPPITDVPPTI